MKKGSFDAFEKLQTKLYEALVLALPNFDKLFDIDYEASGVGMGAILIQYQRPIVYFS